MISVVPQELLEQLAKDTASARRSATSSEDRDTRTQNVLRDWINQHTLKIKNEGSYKDSYRFVLEACPFDPEHKDAAIFLSGYGRSFYCFHDSCKGKTWEDVLLLLDPEADIPPESKKPGPSTSRNWPDPLAPEAFHGLAGEVVHAIEPHSEADPAALLVQFLVGFGSIAGRHAYFATEATCHYPNVYTVIVGQTAKGRKGTSWDQICRVLTGVDNDWRTNRVISGLSTGEGLIWAVRDAIHEHTPVKDKGRIVRYDEVESDPGVKDKRLLVFEPEFARVLKVTEREANTLAAILRESWDHGDLNILTKKQAARATNAHMSIVAHITKDELRRLLTDTAVANGFANRFLWICARRSKLLPEGGTLATVNFPPIHARLRAAVEFQAAGELRRSDLARDLWREVYASLSEGKPGLLGAAISRAEAQVVRLSLIYALLDLSPSILPTHLEAALALWRYAEDSARFIFGDALAAMRLLMRSFASYADAPMA